MPGLLTTILYLAATSFTAAVLPDSTLIRELEATADSAQAHILKSDYARAKPFLDSGYMLWKTADTSVRFGGDNPVNKICNGLALYAMICELNYEKSAAYLIEGLDCAKANGNWDDYVVMGSNLVWTDLIRKNPSGLKYAQEIYEYSKNLDDPMTRYFGSYNISLMLFIKGRFREAEQYLLESLEYAGDDTNARINAYCTYANILHALGNNELASQYFTAAYDNADKLSTVSSIYMYMTYSSYLNDIGDCTKASEIASEGIKLSLEKDNRMFLSQLYLQQSISYSRTGRWHQAYDTRVLHQQYSDSIFNKVREWSINELAVKYETARKEELIQRNKVQLLRRDKALYISLFSILLITAVLAILTHQYRSRNRMYRKIVRQYNDAITRERHSDEEIRRLREELAGHLTQDTSQGRETASENEKSLDEVFRRIEDAMKTGKAYREINLNRERLAAITGTNRTYITRAISENTGKSFVQYVNSYRLREAIEILSEPQMRVPLKALYMEVGFSSNNTFYKMFREEVGMTPAVYRENIENMS